MRNVTLCRPLNCYSTAKKPNWLQIDLPVEKIHCWRSATVTVMEIGALQSAQLLFFLSRCFQLYRMMGTILLNDCLVGIHPAENILIKSSYSALTLGIHQCHHLIQKFSWVAVKSSQKLSPGKSKAAFWDLALRDPKTPSHQQSPYPMSCHLAHM